ncbi:hypothetical protein GLAREA_09066 [Glarea lozoyensis ATCC 20868]|uniref:Uncharacterized protein n=1 Tax=Glarea lozoyensis (strain ATCC 20868 / MF5171) TaxID=1116229 RepID=S3EFE3_GLAL2|nr:uncharacterized protein GLAREA_09066 [Glarea lozoyensis ATCC 20868]EPE36903.1 hypothetical protein GLAREA_09066 [Glarea lozoyensis ATCC 20868]
MDDFTVQNSLSAVEQSKRTHGNGRGISDDGDETKYEDGFKNYNEYYKPDGKFPKSKQYEKNEKQNTYGNDTGSTRAHRAQYFDTKPGGHSSAKHSSYQLKEKDTPSSSTEPRPKLEDAKSSATPQKVEKTHITISDNLSTDNNKKDRRLLALKPKIVKPISASTSRVFSNLPSLQDLEGITLGPDGQPISAAVHDYQTQLALLEAQNKKGLYSPGNNKTTRR